MKASSFCGIGRLYSEDVRRSTNAMIGRWILFPVLMLFCFVGGAVGQREVPVGAPIILLELVLDYKDWPKRRSADTVLELDSIREILFHFSERVGYKVIVRHPGGDSGSGWAVEFREWLVAFGVPSDYIILEPGSGGLDQLLVFVEAMTAAFDLSE